MREKSVSRKESNLNRFRVSREFRVEGVAPSEDTGSLIAMAFR